MAGTQSALNICSIDKKMANSTFYSYSQKE